MQDWFLESLRRALVCGGLVLIWWSVDIPAVRIATLVALVVFLFFLMRNPDGWARRLSYACTMLGASTLVPLGTAIKGSGWLEAGGRLEEMAWLGGLAMQIDDGSPWPGLALVLAGLVFGVLQVWREGRGRPTGGAPGNVLRLQATHRGDGQRVALSLPVENQKPHPITIDALHAKPLRLLDRVLVKDPNITSALVLEGAKPTEQVELPVTIGPARWRRLEIRVSFKAPLARPHLLVVPFWWLLGLHRRYLELCLQNQSEMLQSRALTVLL